MLPAVNTSQNKTPSSSVYSHERCLRLVAAVNYLIKSQGIDNLNQAISLIKSYHIDQFNKNDKEEIKELLEHVENFRVSAITAFQSPQKPKDIAIQMVEYK